MADLNMVYFTIPNGLGPFGRGFAHLSYGPGLNTFGIEGGTLCVLLFGCKWVGARCDGRISETLAQFSQRPITSK